MISRGKFIVLTIAIGVSLSFAGIALKTTDPDLALTINGKGWVESGQFARFFNNGADLDHSWISRTYMDLCLDATYRERLRISLGTEGKMWFNMPKQTGTGQATYVHRQNSSILVSDANVSYLWGDVQSPFLSATVGLFPFKYDPQARNLGEYLFRSGTYPAYIINNFDLPFARLTGLKISSELFGWLHQDLMYSMETAVPPFYNGTITYLADCRVNKFLNIGFGVSFANAVSIDDKAITPKNVDKNRFVASNGDTGYYTFRGTKLMGKICIDPKKFFPPTGIFGKEDCKIYAEAAILGLESYPKNDTINPLNPSISQGKNIWGYDTLANKIPIMFGFNFPAFKLLDVCALEFEWYGCPYPNSYKNRLGPGADYSYPVPDFSKRSNVNFNADNWKWSVYLKRSLFDDHFGIVLQFARDHIRNETLVDEANDYEEALSTNKQWWWMIKFVAQF
jgi:hypothetical protein